MKNCENYCEKTPVQQDPFSFQADPINFTTLIGQIVIEHKIQIIMLKCRNSTKVFVPLLKPMFMSAFPRKSYVRNLLKIDTGFVPFYHLL